MTGRVQEDYPVKQVADSEMALESGIEVGELAKKGVTEGERN